MLCLHCSPPTSDPRAPEQKEPNSLLTDTGESPAHPTAPGQQGSSSPRSHEQRPPAGTAPATAQVRMQQPNDTHQPNNPMNTILTPASQAGNDPQRDSPPHPTASDDDYTT